MVLSKIRTNLNKTNKNIKSAQVLNNFFPKGINNLLHPYDLLNRKCLCKKFRCIAYLGTNKLLKHNEERRPLMEEDL